MAVVVVTVLAVRTFVEFRRPRSARGALRGGQLVTTEAVLHVHLLADQHPEVRGNFFERLVPHVKAVDNTGRHL